LKDQVFVDNQKIGKVTDLIIDTNGWKTIHLEIELTEKVAKKILGVRT
jgi:hypothetical protein